MIKGDQIFSNDYQLPLLHHLCRHSGAVAVQATLEAKQRVGKQIRVFPFTRLTFLPRGM
jgi:hypothetical protein